MGLLRRQGKADPTVLWKLSNLLPTYILNTISHGTSQGPLLELPKPIDSKIDELLRQCPV